MNNATFETLLAIMFAILVVVVPFLVVDIVAPAWLGREVSDMGFHIQHAISAYAQSHWR